MLDASANFFQDNASWSPFCQQNKDLFWHASALHRDAQRSCHDLCFRLYPEPDAEMMPKRLLNKSISHYEAPSDNINYKNTTIAKTNICCLIIKKCPTVFLLFIHRRVPLWTRLLHVLMSGENKCVIERKQSHFKTICCKYWKQSPTHSSTSSRPNFLQ